MSDHHSITYETTDGHGMQLQQLGLPEERANQVLVFLMRWLEERRALTYDFWSEMDDWGHRTFPARLQDLRGDLLLADYMVEEPMRPFVEAYTRTRFGRDCLGKKEGRPGFYYLEYNDASYAQAAAVFEERYAEWQASPDQWAPPPPGWTSRNPRLTAGLVVMALLAFIFGFSKAVSWGADRVFLAVKGTWMETVLVGAIFLGMAWAVGWMIWKARSQKKRRQSREG